jgi:hypothetical protein
MRTDDIAEDRGVYAYRAYRLLAQHTIQVVVCRAYLAISDSIVRCSKWSTAREAPVIPSHSVDPFFTFFATSYRCK